MRFSPTFLDEIRDRVPISAVVARRCSWDRKKTNAARGDYWACCPFHGEKTPSFHCEDRKGRYHCFGCGVSGDHFRFLTELEGMNFVEAVQTVADMAGVAMPAPDPEAEKRARQQVTLLDVMDLATRFFEDQLQSAVGAKARAYLRDRGLSARTIETFRLGYSPDSRNALKEHLAQKGVTKEQIEACGLVVHGSDIPVSYDRFRDRIMFPILSSRERVIAFGGRAMAPDAPAKYLNSNETELFHKGQVLFNFSRARKAMTGADGASTVIAVEGYMDVIALHQAGIRNAVAPLGTALTENQLELLWRMSPVPVLCFDGDQAGLRAASRAADLALPFLKPGFSLSFAILPDGKDPDDLVKTEGRAPFDRVMADAKPLADMLWSRETAGGVFDTPEKRAELEARLRMLTARIGDESVRRHYQQAMRDRLYTFFQGEGQAMRRQPNRGGQGQAGRGGNRETLARGIAVSDRLARSTMVSNRADRPGLRECALALTIVNHPQILLDDYDDVSAIEFSHRDLQRLWSAILSAAGLFASGLDRESLKRSLVSEGFGDLVGELDRQVRVSRLWTATEQAATDDAREGFLQALALHRRARSLNWQVAELQREIADATEAGEGEEVAVLMRTLEAVKNEVSRLENQEAIVDGFGVSSGRVKGPAGSGR